MADPTLEPIEDPFKGQLEPIENPFKVEPSVDPMSGAPLPQAFGERLAHGEAINEQLQKHTKRGAWNEFTGADGGPRYQLWLEKFVREPLERLHDVRIGNILTGPGLRKEDFSDDPNAPEPLEALHAAAGYGIPFVGGGIAGSVALAESMTPGFASTGLIPAGPLVKDAIGTVHRLYSDAEGTMRSQPVGPPPAPQDFANAASVIEGKNVTVRPTTEAERANFPSLAKLHEYWETRGLHPAEIAQEALQNEFLRHDLSSAAAEPTDAPMTPFYKQQPPAPSRVLEAVRSAIDRTYSLGRDLQKMVAPMAVGSSEATAIAKDTANNLRWNRWEWNRYDDHLTKKFTEEQRERMWNAADEESVLRQEGHPSEHMGLSTLTDVERATVEDLQTRAQYAWSKARDLGMVQGEGLPAYTPRMVLNIAAAASGDKPTSLNAIGGNVRTRTAQMLQRKFLTAEETEAAMKDRFGETAVLARDIRTLPLATARLEDAITGRSLIENIKEYGDRTGSRMVNEGGAPEGANEKWFTIDHPAFRTWRPKLVKVEDGGWTTVKDEAGETIMQQQSLFVHGDFEGPLRAILDPGKFPGKEIYQALMELKGKTMSLIMNSPVIHNAVEWSRAFPADLAGTTTPALTFKTWPFRVYKDGLAVKNDPMVMQEAIQIGGLVPIGKRFFKQDIDSIMEAPDLVPGRSTTSKLAAAIPGLFSEGAEVAVKKAVDKMGNLWHNTLLWDRIADLQMGLYKGFMDELLQKGVDRTTAARAAGHMANRYAGSLPKEAMSNWATVTANMLLFSRTFTMGNLGVMKDAFIGLPKDVQSQIMRDAGEGALSRINSMVKRKALATVMIDMTFGHASNSILQNTMNVMFNDSDLDQEMHGYVSRARDAMKKVEDHPLNLMSYTNFIPSLSATHTNEPGKQDRVMVGYDKDGTGIYIKSPLGKMGEEFEGYLTGPLDMFRRKLGTFARPAWQIMSNDKGFGHKVYDPFPETTGEQFQNLVNVVKTIINAQTPQGQIAAFGDLVKGDGDAKVNTLKLLGPMVGFNASVGAPGGPAVGEMYGVRSKYQYAVDQAMPEIKKLIRRGDIVTAKEQMTTLGINSGLQRYYIRTTQNPSARLSARSVRDFYLHATPEQKARFEQNRSPRPLTAPGGDE